MQVPDQPAPRRRPSGPQGAQAVLLRLLYQLGWRVGPRIPAVLQEMVISAGAAIAVDRGGRPIDQYAENLRYATGREPDQELLRAGIASYLRNFLEMFSLPGWSRSKIIARVSTSGEGDLRRAMADQGAVIALPHSGNWDLAGAWACLTGMPVSTVAEELSGPEYEEFLAFREGLGMQVIGHRDPAALSELMAAVRRGRLICLVADRDLVGSGVPVTWNGHPVTMPAGPALVARRTGAALFPMVTWFTNDGLRLDIGPRIAHRPGRAGLVAMIQDEADYFADRIARRPQDWHLMQPFFTRGPAGASA
ncbi:lipid A biosynthesis lauroyl acyltransferase [Microlunatus endophyticus]|uniref:Lipid A biosynthesis lauroyl acyltransferase n=1 Tax=Microlunatus endophyticus TaxID=1716077 RepID=A0A917S2D0_9ACTN|nr:phosphatidylinositol mannoside acyltransferase [Microlunatus endophyticus]GGL52498.1 lipid A biosynthesis lauroyl acyltransferase [Microlunatus endophyticus]